MRYELLGAASVMHLKGARSAAKQVSFLDMHLSAEMAWLQVERDAGKVTKVAPLPHMFVVKDLVVDMSNFYAQYKSINPFLQKRENP